MDKAGDTSGTVHVYKIKTGKSYDGFCFSVAMLKKSAPLMQDLTQAASRMDSNDWIAHTAPPDEIKLLGAVTYLDAVVLNKLKDGSIQLEPKIEDCPTTAAEEEVVLPDGFKTGKSNPGLSSSVYWSREAACPGLVETYSYSLGLGQAIVDKAQKAGLPVSAQWYGTKFAIAQRKDAAAAKIANN